MKYILTKTNKYLFDSVTNTTVFIMLFSCVLLQSNNLYAQKSFGKKFDFLGFTFKPCSVTKRGGGNLFLGYGCAISQAAQTKIIQGWTQLNWHRKSNLTIQDIAGQVNSQMRGIIRYYGKFKLQKLQRLMWHFEFRLVKWVLNKYGKFKNSQTKAYQWIKELKQSYPTMFYYWTIFKHV